MRLPGYCTECRRFKQVRVSGSALARGMASGGTVSGICSWCEDKPNRERQEAARRANERNQR